MSARKNIERRLAQDEDPGDVITEYVRLAERGLIDEVTPCVISGFVYDLPATVIASACNGV